METKPLPLVGDWNAEKMLLSGRSSPKHKEFRGLVGNLHVRLLKRLEGLSRVGAPGISRFFGGTGYYGFVLDLDEFPLLRLRRFRPEAEEPILYPGEERTLLTSRKSGRSHHKIPKPLLHRPASLGKDVFVRTRVPGRLTGERFEAGQEMKVAGASVGGVESGHEYAQRALFYTPVGEERVVVRPSPGDRAFVSGSEAPSVFPVGRDIAFHESFVMPTASLGSTVLVTKRSFLTKEGLKLKTSTGLPLQRRGYRTGVHHGSKTSEGSTTVLQEAVETYKGGVYPGFSLRLPDDTFRAEVLTPDFYPALNIDLLGSEGKRVTLSGAVPTVLGGLAYEGLGAQSGVRGLLRMEMPETLTLIILRKALETLESEGRRVEQTKRALSSARPSLSRSTMFFAPATPVFPSAVIRAGYGERRHYGVASRAHEGVSSFVQEGRKEVASNESVVLYQEKAFVPYGLVFVQPRGVSEGFSVFPTPYSVTRASAWLGAQGLGLSASDLILRSFLASAGGLKGYLSSSVWLTRTVRKPAPDTGSRFERGRVLDVDESLVRGVISELSIGSGIDRIFARGLGIRGLGQSALDYRLVAGGSPRGGYERIPVFGEFEPIFVRLLRRFYLSGGARHEEEPLKVGLSSSSRAKALEVTTHARLAGPRIGLTGPSLVRRGRVSFDQRGVRVSERLLDITVTQPVAALPLMAGGGGWGAYPELAGAELGSTSLGAYRALAGELDELERVFLSLRKHFSVLRGVLSETGDVVPYGGYGRTGSIGFAREGGAVPISFGSASRSGGARYVGRGTSKQEDRVGRVEGFASNLIHGGIVPGYVAVSDSLEQVLIFLQRKGGPIGSFMGSAAMGLPESERGGVRGFFSGLGQDLGIIRLLNRDYTAQLATRTEAKMAGFRGGGAGGIGSPAPSRGVVSPTLTLLERIEKPFVVPARETLDRMGASHADYRTQTKGAGFRGEGVGGIGSPALSRWVVSPTLTLLERIEKPWVVPAWDTSERIPVTYPERLLFRAGHMAVPYAGVSGVMNLLEFSFVKISPPYLGERFSHMGHANLDEQGPPSVTLSGRRQTFRVPSLVLDTAKDPEMGLLFFAPIRTRKGESGYGEGTSAERFSGFFDRVREAGAGAREASSEVGSSRVVVKPQAVEGKLPGIPEKAEVFEWEMEKVSFGGGRTPLNVSSDSFGLFRDMVGTEVRVVRAEGIEPALGGSLPLISQGGGLQASVALASKAQGAPKGGSPAEEKKSSQATSPVDLEVLAIEMAERIMERIRREKERRGNYG